MPESKSSKPSKPEDKKLANSKNPLVGGRYVAARDAYLTIHKLINNPSRTIKEIDFLLKKQNLADIFQAVKVDLDQLTELLDKAVKDLFDFLNCDDRLPEKGIKSTGDNPNKGNNDQSKTDLNEGNKTPPLCAQLETGIDMAIKSHSEQQASLVSNLVKIEISGIISKCVGCEKLTNKLIQEDRRRNVLETEIKEWGQKLQEEQQNKSKVEVELTETQNQLSTLTKQVEELQNEKNCMEQSMKMLQDEKDMLQKQIKEQQSQLQHVETKYSVKVAPENFVHVEEMMKLRSRLKDTELRLAAEMGSKVSADESSLENISIKARPMNIAGDYDHLCSHSWLTIKTFLDNNIKKQEDKKIQFLTEVLMVSEYQAGQYFTEAKEWLLAMTQDPLQVKHNANSVKVAELLKGMDQSKDEIYIKDKFRICADCVNLEVLEKSIKTTVMKKLKSKYNPCTDKFKGKTADEYVTDCARLTWKMVIQRPPMRFNTDTDIEWRGNEKVVEPAWGSNAESEKAVIQFYRHPTLYHGNAVMVKGKAIIK